MSRKRKARQQKQRKRWGRRQQRKAEVAKQKRAQQAKDDQQQAAIRAQLATTGIYERLAAAAEALKDPAFSDAFNAARASRDACKTLDEVRDIVVGLLKEPPWQRDLTGVTFKLSWDPDAKTLPITAVLEMEPVYEAMRAVGALPAEASV